MQLRLLTALSALAWMGLTTVPLAADEKVATVHDLIASHHLRGPDAVAVLRPMSAATLREQLPDVLPFTYWYDSATLGRMAQAKAVAREFGIRVLRAPAGLLVIPTTTSSDLRTVRRLLAFEHGPAATIDDVVNHLADDPETLELVVTPLPADGATEAMTLNRLPTPSGAEGEGAGVETAFVAGRLVITITEFVAGRTRPALDDALAELKAPVERVILDLRWSSGGDLVAAINVAGLFLPDETMIVRLRPPLRGHHEWRTARPGVFAETPLVVLASPWTASAAEVLVQAFKSLDRAVVLGSRTRGKCVVQQVFNAGADRLWVPVAELLPPTAVAGCHGRGVDPHVVLPAELWGDDWALLERANIYNSDEVVFLCSSYRYRDAATARTDAKTLPRGDLGIDVVLLGGSDAPRLCIGPAREGATLAELVRGTTRESWWRDVVIWRRPGHTPQP